MDFKCGYPYTSYIDVKISEDKGARVLIHNRTSSGKNSMMFIQFDSILPYCLIMFPEVFPLKKWQVDWHDDPMVLTAEPAQIRR